LTQAFQTTRKGIVWAGPATKIQDGNAPGDNTGEVTLIGLVETTEGTTLAGLLERKYNFNMSSWCTQAITAISGTCPLDSTSVQTTVVSTTFVP
jgi:hypothetical protein